MSDYAIAGGIHPGQNGAHVPVDLDGAADAAAGSRRGGEVGVRADDDEHEVCLACQSVAVPMGLDTQPGCAIGGAGDGCDGGSREDLDPVPIEFGVDEDAELGVPGGQDLGEGFDLSDGRPAGGEARRRRSRPRGGRGASVQPVPCRSVGDVDAGRQGVQPQPEAGGLQVGDGAVGEVAPVRDLTGDVVRGCRRWRSWGRRPRRRR
jgi:hypothetical protein